MKSSILEFVRYLEVEKNASSHTRRGYFNDLMKDIFKNVQSQATMFVIFLTDLQKRTRNQLFQERFLLQSPFINF
jgi:site-specific recombinase XerD